MVALLVAAAACAGSTAGTDAASGASNTPFTRGAASVPTTASIAASPAATNRATAETEAVSSTTASGGPVTDTVAATTTVPEAQGSPAGSSATDEVSGTEGLAEPAGVEPVDTVDPLVALQAVDWRNDWYSVVCPGPERTGVQLVDGEFRPTDFGHLRGLGDVEYGEIDDQSGAGRRTVAAVDIICIGASHFPSTWLLYGAEPDGTVVELGMVAGGAMPVANVDPPYWWEADAGVFVDGLLHLRGRGYSPRAAHCCPDYDVYAAFALGPDGPVEVAHHETRDLTVPTMSLG